MKDVLTIKQVCRAVYARGLEQGAFDRTDTTDVVMQTITTVKEYFTVDLEVYGITRSNKPRINLEALCRYVYSQGVKKGVDVSSEIDDRLTREYGIDIFADMAGEDIDGVLGGMLAYFDVEVE